MRPAIVPRADDAAGAFDDGNERQHVVRLELGLDHEIDMAGGEHAIGVAIAAIARQPDLLLDSLKAMAVVLAHQQRTGREQYRVVERRAGAGVQRPVAGRAAITLAATPSPSPVKCSRVNGWCIMP